MAKLGVVLKTSSLDFSAHGYIAAAIERLDVDNLSKFLDEYEAEAVDPYIESLFELALENIDRAIEDNANEDALDNLFDVINELVSSKKFIGDKPSESLLLPKLLDKLIDLRLNSGLSNDSSLKKDMLEGIESSIVQLSNSYNNNNEFLKTLSDRETIVQDIDALREISGEKGNKLKITDKEYDSFLKMRLMFMDRVEEWKSLESREKKTEFNPEAKQAILDDLKDRNRTLFDLYNSSFDLLSIALSGKRDDINNLDEKGFSLLHYACLDCNVELIEDLIKQGANTTLLSRGTQLSPLNMLSMSEKSNKSVEAFNALGISNLDDKLSPLLAMKSGNAELAKALIDASNSQEEIINTILRRAVQSDDYDVVKYVLAEIKSRNIKFESKEILQISINGSGSGLSALLESGLIKGQINTEVLKTAVLSGNERAVKAILDLKSKDLINIDISVKQKKTVKGPDVNILDYAYDEMLRIKNENTSYSVAFDKTINADEKNDINSKINSNLNRIERIYGSINNLLEYKGEDMLDVNVAFHADPENNKRNFLLDTYGELSICRKDLENGNSTQSKANVQRLENTLYNLILHPISDVTITDQYGQNIFMLAAQQGDTRVFGSAISKIEDKDVKKVLDAKDSAGNTVVFHAAEVNKEDVFNLLISSGASVRDDEGNLIRNNRKMTPLMIAAKGANKVIISEYIKPLDKDVLEVDDIGNTPMHYLAMGLGGDGVPDILGSFIELGADINAKNIDGRSPLIQAVLSGNSDLVRELIEMGADVNTADKYGNTPLIYACLLNNEEVIKSVLSSTFVDVNKANYQGVSPYLIVAQRDGLEGLSKSMNLQDTDLSNVKNFRDKWGDNNYKDLAKVLISRGAEPYLSEAKSLYDRFMSVTYALTAAKVSAEATTLIASSAPSVLKIAPNLVKMSGNLLASKVVYNEVNRGVQQAVMSWLTNGTNYDNRINLNDEIMIGSFRDEGIWFIKYGDSLKSEIMKHPNFVEKGNENNGIYTVNDLKEVLQKKDEKWLLKAHESLTSKYVSLQKKIESQPWYYNVFMPWKRMGLNRAAENVLMAHDAMVSAQSATFLKSGVEGIQYSTFEEQFGQKGGLIDLVTLSSKSFMDSIIYNLIKNGDDKDPSIIKANEIINDVVQKNISVSPKTFYLFSKFAAERDRFLNSSQAKKEEFSKIYRAGDPFRLNLNDGFIETLKTNNNNSRDNNGKKYIPKTFKSNAYIIDSLKYFCQEDNPYKVRDNIATFIGGSLGAAASVYSFAAADKTYAAALVNLGLTGIGLVAANPITTATGVGLYVAAQYQEPVVSAVKEWGSSAYSYAKDTIAWFFTPKDQKVEVKNTRDASDLLINTEQAVEGLKALLPEVSRCKDEYVSSLKEEVVKKPEVVVGNINLATGTTIQVSADDSPNIKSDAVVNEVVKNEVSKEQKKEKELSENKDISKT